MSYVVKLRDYGRPRGVQAGPMGREEAIEEAKRLAQEASEASPTGSRVTPSEWTDTPGDGWESIGHISYATKTFFVERQS